MNEAAYDLAVAELYGAAAGQRPWADALGRVVELLGAFAAYLHGVNLADGTVAFGYDVGGFHPDAALEYIRRYHDIDPRVALVLRRGIGDWTNCHEHFDDEHVSRDPFYQDFLIPYGGRYVSGAKVYQDDEIVAVLGIHRGMGMQPLNAAELDISRRLGLHVGQALTIWRAQRQLLRQALVGNAVLQRMTQPVLLLDEQMQLHFSNRSATDLLQRDSRLGVHDGKLAFSARDTRSELSVALRQLLIEPRTPGSSRHDKVVLAVPASDGQAPLVLIVTALRPQETMGAFGPTPMALVLLHDTAARPALDPFVLASAFGLTPAEARVAVHLATGLDVDAVAQRLNVAASTVRSQVRQVFAKVGVSRQSELAAALSGLRAVVG
jgi:DNA-binding CsgD family transcriptional regulator